MVSIVMELQQPLIGTNISDMNGIQLVNPTAAADGAQQNSPPIAWLGNGFNYTTQVSETVEFLAYVVPVEMIGDPTGSLVFASSINGAAPQPRFQFDSAGNLTLSTGKVVIQRPSASGFFDLTDTTYNKTYQLSVVSGALEFINANLMPVLTLGDVGAGITVNGTTYLTGGGYIQPLGTPSAPTVTSNVHNGVTWGYRITAESRTGQTLASAEGLNTNGPSSLHIGLNANTITWPAAPGAFQYWVYRTTAGGTPSSTGFLHKVLPTSSPPSYSDIGDAASGSLPTVNLSGSFNALGAGSFGSTLSLAPGSATVPALNFTAYPSTGIWSPAANVVSLLGYFALNNGDFAASGGIRFRNTADGSIPTGGGMYEANNNNLYLQAGQANVIELRDGSGNTLGQFTNNGPGGSTLNLPAGAIVRPLNTDSTTALQYATYAGSVILNIDSSNQRLGIGTTTPKSALHIAGGLTLQAASKSANYAMTVQDCAIMATGGTSGITITLPAASTGFGFLAHIKKTDSGAVTVAAAGSDTIEGAGTVALATRYNSLTLLADGAATWYKIAVT